MNKYVTKSTLTAAIFGLAGAFALNASAETMGETTVRAHAPSKAVSYTRSELATADGRAAVEDRIRQAAEQICGSTSLHEAGSIAIVSQRKACRSDAVDRAMSSIGADQVAAAN